MCRFMLLNDNEEAWLSFRSMRIYRSPRQLDIIYTTFKLSTPGCGVECVAHSAPDLECCDHLSPWIKPLGTQQAALHVPARNKGATTVGGKIGAKSGARLEDTGARNFHLFAAEFLSCISQVDGCGVQKNWFVLRTRPTLYVQNLVPFVFTPCIHNSPQLWVAPQPLDQAVELQVNSVHETTTRFARHRPSLLMR